MEKTLNKTEMILRNKIADYMGVVSGETTIYVLMGTGFNTLDENPSAQMDSKTYIHNSSATSWVKSYNTVFPFDTDLIASEEAVMALYNIGRNQKTGSEAELDYIRVELFQKGTGANTFKARKFKVAAEISSFAGGGGETIKVTGNLNNIGAFVDGEFNTATKTFTENVVVE